MMPRGIESYVSGAQIVRQGVNAKSIVERKLRGKVMLLDNPQKSNSLSVGSKGGASAERKRKGRKAEERARKALPEWCTCDRVPMDRLARERTQRNFKACGRPT